MTATAFAPRPPRGPLDALFDFIRKHDPTTLRGGVLYAVFGLVLGLFWGLA